MTTGLTLVCPVRGTLKVTGLSSDGLTPSEELIRVEAIRHLVSLGYPKEHFMVEVAVKRFGNAGRNSFRADFAVLDEPASPVHRENVDKLLEHAIVLAEVKRDNSSAKKAKEYQVVPMLDFAVRDDCVALYWDSVEQRVYWLTRERGIKQLHEGPLADLPGFGEKPDVRRLTYQTIDPNKPLLEVFRRIEDLLHGASIGPQRRFTIMLQLLLAKLYDEHKAQVDTTTPLHMQDFAALSVSPGDATRTVDDLVKSSLKYYQAFLPERVPSQLRISPTLLLEITRILAPIKITAMRQSVIQDFYMYFAKHIYKWDLAQYFTPTSLTEFIIEVLNPRLGEHIKDPACGSADFLTAAFRRGQGWPDYASSIWGADVSTEAVQVAVLNMILNGDGKTNISEEDSLAKIRKNAESCDVVVCNPPFGSRIVENNQETLSNFDLGHAWAEDRRGWNPTSTVLKKQESGILFVEACVKLLRPGGRLAIILPNGYLGNRSEKYVTLREWLLRHTRIGTIVALPRFTFKSSGADVSASVLFCEKRHEVLREAAESEEYEYCVEVADRVGWKTGDKRGQVVHRRDPVDGTYLVGEDGQLILDSDFPAILRRIRVSSAVTYSPWIVTGLGAAEQVSDPGWTVSIRSVTKDHYLTIDPKRHCRKFTQVRTEIEGSAHFRLGDVVDFIPDKVSSDGTPTSIKPACLYKYVEIKDVEVGTHRWVTKRGWDLPDRAQHHAELGDIYIGSIRNSVRKWFLVGAGADQLIVTNGMHRMRLKPGFEDYLLDLAVGLSSEAYRVQMRGLARGADGLAEISIEDAATVLFSRVVAPATRKELAPYVEQLSNGMTTLEAKIDSLSADGRLGLPDPPRQPDHTALV
jgi:type I restriction enzyme M protein